MEDEKKKKRLQKLKYTLEELSALAKIASSPEFATLERVINRYIRNLRDISYKLPEENPNYLMRRHAELVGMGLGAKQVVLMLKKADTRFDEQEDEVEKLQD